MNSARHENRGIAIVGLSGRFPGAQTVSDLWANISGGKSGIRAVSPRARSRLPADPNYVAKSATVENADRFDAEFFRIYPKQAQEMDPQHRLFLEVCWSALEDAGYRPDATRCAVGVFAGCHMNTYIFQRLAADSRFREELADSFPGGNLSTEISNDKDYLATRVAFHLNLTGPCVAVQTACSTSLVAIAQGCQSLESLQCDMALAGGVTVTFPQDQGYLHTEDSILSPDGTCRTFDADAKGTIFGDGVGAVVLKRLDDALRDRDEIYAVVKGWGVNNDGGDKGGYTAPSMEGQSRAILAAHQKAGVSADTINYVEAHGTGTLVGDPIEVAALTAAFRQSTTNKNYCAIGSLKSNVGHLDVAAGVAAVIKTALALQHRQIPPTINFAKPNPRIDFANSPFVVQQELTEWRPVAPGVPRRAGVSSFGVGGTNAHLVLEEAPLREEASRAASAAGLPELICVSANSPASLDAMCHSLADWLDTNVGCDLGDVSYTQLSTRKPLPYRMYGFASSAKEAAAALRSERAPSVRTPNAAPQLGFMFPGQGSQHIGMAQDLFDWDPFFREQIDVTATAFLEHMDVDLRELIFDKGHPEQPIADINETSLAQPALFMISYAIARWFQNKGLQPNCLIGHSVGEFAAAAIAGVMSLADAARLVATRGRLMQDLPPGAMLAVNLSSGALREILPGDLDVAAVNAPELCVVSGGLEAIARFEAEIERGQYGENLTCRALRTSHAFHSVMMDPAIAGFGMVVKQIELSPPTIPIYSTVTAEILSSDLATSPDYWAKQIREPVLFSDTLKAVLKTGAMALLEVGPGQALSTLARQQKLDPRQHCVVSSLPHVKQATPGLRHACEAIGKLWRAGVDLDPERISNQPAPQRVRLPTYCFDKKRFWFEVAKLDQDELAPQTVAASSQPEPQATELSSKPPAVGAEALPREDACVAESAFPQRLIRQHMQIMNKQLDLLSKRPS